MRGGGGEPASRAARGAAGGRLVARTWRRRRWPAPSVRCSRADRVTRSGPGALGAAAAGAAEQPDAAQRARRCWCCSAPRAAADDREGAASAAALTRVADEAGAGRPVPRGAAGRPGAAGRAHRLGGVAARRAPADRRGRPAAPVRRRRPRCVGTTRCRRGCSPARCARWRPRSDGDTRRAAGEVRRGLAELGSYQHSFGSLDLRTASAVHGSALARLGPAAGAAATARRPTCWPSSSAAARSRPGCRRCVRPSDPASAELLAAMRRVEEEIRGLEGDPAAADAVAAAAARGLDPAARRSGPAPGSSRGGAVPSTRRRAPPGSGMAAAPDGSVFVSFARDRGRWVAVVARRAADPSGATWRRSRGARAGRAGAGRPRRAGRCRPCPTCCGPPYAAAWTWGWPARRGWCWRRSGCAGRRLVLSCSGDLMLLPWGLLPSRLGRPTSVTPSAAAWLRAQGAGARPAPRVVAIAGPDLRLAEAEAAHGGGLWPGARALRGARGDDRGGLRRARHGRPGARQCTRHGTAPTARCSRRCVSATARSTPTRSIPGAGLAGCVVLSACDAGLATTRPGEEMLGLAQVLLHLASSSVVAAVARVNDEVSAAVHGRRSTASSSQENDVSASLAAAQRESLDCPSPAAFVSYGATW